MFLYARNLSMLPIWSARSFKRRLLFETWEVVVCASMRPCMWMIWIVFEVQLVGLHSAPLPSSPAAGSVPKYSSVGICVLSIDRSVDDEELEYERHLLGSSAIMFVLNNDMATAQVCYELELNYTGVLWTWNLTAQVCYELELNCTGVLWTWT